MNNSFGTGPIVLGARKPGLTPDDLMVLSTSGLVPTTFARYSWFLGSTGAGTASSLGTKRARLGEESGPFQVTSTTRSAGVNG